MPPSYFIRILCAVFLYIGIAHADQIPNQTRSQGSESAQITLEEYASFTCPFCGKFHREVVSELLPNYIENGQVHYIYRDFPLDGTALGASMLAECVGGDDNDRYFKFVDLLYDKQNAWLRADNIKDTLFGYAALAGLDGAAAEKCLQDKALYDEVVAERKHGEAQGVNATPSVFINGKAVEDFSAAALKKQLDELVQ